jgi:AcrR family transcriptional regulator
VSTAATRRLTREVWIGAALNILATEAVDEVAVERLAEQLGVTKGSFYWHFRDRAKLITAALRHWALKRTRRPHRQPSLDS